MKIAFITNMCTHYRMPIFNLLAEQLGVDFYFFSKGTEKYWNPRLGIVEEGKNFHYLNTGRFFPTMLSLVWKLVSGRYDVVIKCTNGKLALPAAFLTAKLTGKKFILWQTIWYHPQTLFHRISYPLLRFIQNRSDSIVVYGQHGKDYLTGLGVDPKKTFIGWQTVDNSLYNQPVSDEEKIRLKADIGIGNQKVILFVGRLEEVKGLRFLVEAFFRAGVEESVLVLIGDGPEKARVAGLAAQWGIQNRVRNVRFVPNQELYRYYAIADLFVLPSITTPKVKEAWGLVVNEAMNQGCPIVATDAVGAAVGGLVQHDINGLVVREQQVGELTEAFRKILINESLRRSMSNQSRQIIQIWTYERMFEGFAQAIQYCSKTGKDTCDFSGNIAGS
jgi:glycosyltransferase involved in cell wall biosynthesis